MARLYPVSLILKDRKCVVVGGGTVASRKAASLVEAGARVTVIGPEICDEIEDLERVETIRREFTEPDLDGVFLVIGATDSSKTNERVAAEAERRGVLANMVDVTQLGNCYVSSSVKRGDFHIGISTGGTSPALAKKVRRELEAAYGPEYEVLTRLLGEYRDKVIEAVDDAATRRVILTRFADAGLAVVIKESGETAARDVIDAIIAEECAQR